MIDDKLLAYVEHVATGRLVAIQEANVWLRLGAHGQPLKECLHHAQDLHEVLSDYEQQLAGLGFGNAVALHCEIGRQLAIAIRKLASANS